LSYINNKKPLDATVVVCTKNSSDTIHKCLIEILKQNPSKLYVVDAFSTDATREIVGNLGVQIIDGLGRGLTADRQLGIENSKSDFTFFIDCDHVIPPDFIEKMLEIIQKDHYVLVQSQLEILNPLGLLNLGEQAYYELFHNNPKEKIIPGIAPAVFRTKLLASGSGLEIDDGSTSTIEDTSWATKALQQGAKIGIQGPIVAQFHSSGFFAYLKKFKWYGIGDGEFCHSHPNLAISHYYHLLFRYPIVYSFRAIWHRKIRAIPFLIFQGVVRFTFCIQTHLKLRVRRFKDE
jgi:glycosyltransferase involved in cell wall biosynthesis